MTTPSFYSKKNLPGLLLCLGLALPAWWLGKRIPVAGGPVLGMLFGMLAANFTKLPAALSPGVKATAKRVLQTAIVLFGFQMNLGHVLELGGQATALVFVTIAVAGLVSALLGKAIGLAGNERTLIGVGTAICGGSAIAAVAPIVEAEDDEVARAISTIFLFNVMAAFVFPAVGHLMGMSDLRFGMWAGAAINDTSSVVAAGYAYSEAAGSIATVVKLTRTLMIIPVSLFFALRRSKKDQTASAGQGLMSAFPWFVAAFLVACIANTVGVVPAPAAKLWGSFGKFLIVVAMAAIGLGCNLWELVKNGKKPIFLGLCCSLSVALASLLAQALLGIS
ncbi:MAG: YeiH family putative sulfate export transporter [Clostridiales bacterium]|nr:YeiH family putative sulfate export transporter [Clostridiales bacterium]